MARRYSILTFLLITSFISAQTTFLDGINGEVEIYVDPYGIAHIYADDEADMFFAQGYHAAKDRLFQFEIWRRQATGTVAEILGKKELKRDIGTRLFKFRGNMDDEMNHYHPHGKLIIESFVKGVNAYIQQTKKNPKLLPIEFSLLGIQPELWTSDVVISRHQGLLGNIDDELDIGRLVALLGPEKVKEISWFHPQDPPIELDPKIDKDLLFDDILALYNAYRRPIRFTPEDLVVNVGNDWEKYRNLAMEDEDSYYQLLEDEKASIGSNNWVIDGDHTRSGYPMMANDPHRTLAVPSLRYMIHLVGPGWNVIGGGEPEIPGISIGHNDHGAWGLTVYRTDAEDLYVYKTNPENPDQYRYQEQWEDFKTIVDTIYIKDSEPEIVTLKYSRHGPVVYEDQDHHAAFAVRCGWLEIGGSPYLASLRMGQAKNWEEFREACDYSHIPGENMVWADREGNIGWQAVGIAPIRSNFSGLVPVPGDGSYEWDGYLPINEKPHLYNPRSGMIITANEDVTPKSYKHWEAIGYSWGDTYRGDRLAELLNNGKIHSLNDMMNYQTDYKALASSELIPMLDHIQSTNELVNQAIEALQEWDQMMTKDSYQASIYFEWEKNLKMAYEILMVPEEARDYYSPQLQHVINWLTTPVSGWNDHPIQQRDSFLLVSLEEAVYDLSDQFGNTIFDWTYGKNQYKHVWIKHPLSNAVNDSMRHVLDVGPAPRGGYGYTVNNTSNNLNQRSGASFRIIVDTENWKKSVAMNSPGQSGDPESPYYNNLFDLWVKDRFFPLLWAKKDIITLSQQHYILKSN